MFENFSQSMRWTLIGLAAFGVFIATSAAVIVSWIAVQHALSFVESDRTPGPHIVIGLDISNGSPLVDDPVFADRAGAEIRDLLAPLGSRTDVSVRGFGDFGTSGTALDFDRRLNLRNNGARVGRLLDQVIAGVPSAVEKGRVKLHTESNIIGFLESMSGSVNCARETRIVLITDGVEDSEYLRPGTGQDLPDPDRDLYEDCALLQIIGVGFGQPSPTLAKDLDHQWKDWANTAGFAAYRGQHSL